MTDEELIKFIKEDNYLCYNILFNKYYDKLCCFAYKYILNQDDTKDIVQDTFITLWEKRKYISINNNVKYYLYSITKNKALNYLRNIKHQKKYMESNYKNLLSSNNDSFDYEFYKAEIFDCINKLPPKNKKIFLLSRLQGMEQQKIANLLSISTKTIKNQIWISLKRIKKCIDFKNS